MRKTKRKTRLRIAIVSIVGSVAIFAGACSGISGESQTLADGTKAAFRGTADVSGRHRVVIETNEYFFKPTILEGDPGQKVKLVFSNQGQQLHSFTLPSQHIDEDLTAGQPLSVVVTFPEHGATTFFCKYHLHEGMRGELRVRG